MCADSAGKDKGMELTSTHEDVSAHIAKSSRLLLRMKIGCRPVVLDKGIGDISAGAVFWVGNRGGPVTDEEIKDWLKFACDVPGRTKRQVVQDLLDHCKSDEMSEEDKKVCIRAMHLIDEGEV